jgi:hypothetical protein
MWRIARPHQFFNRKAGYIALTEPGGGDAARTAGQEAGAIYRDMFIARSDSP